LLKKIEEKSTPFGVTFCPSDTYVVAGTTKAGKFFVHKPLTTAFLPGRLSV